MIEISKIVAAVEEIEIESVETEADGFTPYQIWKVVNQTFEAIGSEKRIVSQQMYQYAKAGRINGVKGCKRYTEAEVESFVAKFVAKNR